MGNLNWVRLLKDNKLRSVVNRKMNTCATSTAKNFWSLSKKPSTPLRQLGYYRVFLCNGDHSL
jgi:hypothetical protein